MLRHIVMWKFKDFADGALKTQNLHQTKVLFEALASRIPEIKSLEIGLNTIHSGSSYDIVLVSDFENLESLRAYQSHPEHIKVVDFLDRVQNSKVVVDYEIGS